MVSCQPAAPGTRWVPRWSFVPVPGEQRRGPTAAAALRRHVPGAGVVPVASGGERPAGAALASQRHRVRPGVGGTGRGVPQRLRGTNPSASHLVQKQNRW